MRTMIGSLELWGCWVVSVYPIWYFMFVLCLCVHKFFQNLPDGRDSVEMCRGNVYRRVGNTRKCGGQFGLDLQQIDSSELRFVHICLQNSAFVWFEFGDLFSGEMFETCKSHNTSRFDVMQLMIIDACRALSRYIYTYIYTCYYMSICREMQRGTGIYIFIYACWCMLHS